MIFFWSPMISWHISLKQKIEIELKHSICIWFLHCLPLHKKKKKKNHICIWFLHILFNVYHWCDFCLESDEVRKSEGKLENRRRKSGWPTLEEQHLVAWRRGLAQALAACSGLGGAGSVQTHVGGATFGGVEFGLAMTACSEPGVGGVFRPGRCRKRPNP